MGIGGAPGSNSHGTLTLGSDVALMTSTDNSVWTDTTADPSIRTLYMKTFERPTVDVYLIDQTSAEQSDVRIWAWGSAGNIAADWNDRPAMAYQGADAVVNREGVNGDPYTCPYYKFTLDVGAYGDGLLFTGPNGQSGNCELTEAQKEAGFAVFYLYYSDNGLGASAGDDVWKFVSHSDASCTQPAIDVYEGMLTSAEDSIQRGSALGHSWGEWVVTTEPGCLTDGEQTRECSVCHETETETLDALGHDFSVLVEEHPADCTTGGYKLYKCSRCDETETRDETEALGHDYRSFTFAPTCTRGGSTTYTCLRCGDSYVEYTDPLGHDFSVLVEEHSADCTTGGYKVYKCSRCNETEIRDETEALGHNYETLVTEPGCTTGGYTTYTCSRCGDSYQDDFTEAPHFAALLEDPGEKLLKIRKPRPVILCPRGTEMLCGAFDLPVQISAVKAIRQQDVGGLMPDGLRKIQQDLVCIPEGPGDPVGVVFHREPDGLLHVLLRQLRHGGRLRANPLQHLVHPGKIIAEPAIQPGIQPALILEGKGQVVQPQQADTAVVRHQLHFGQDLALLRQAQRGLDPKALLPGGEQRTNIPRLAEGLEALPLQEKGGQAAGRAPGSPNGLLVGDQGRQENRRAGRGIHVAVVRVISPQAIVVRFSKEILRKTGPLPGKLKSVGRAQHIVPGSPVLQFLRGTEDLAA